MLSTVANKPDRFLTLNTWKDAQLALGALYELFEESDQGHNVMLFFGAEQSDFYGVKNCRIATALLGDDFCKEAVSRGMQFVFYVRNDQIKVGSNEIMAASTLAAPFGEAGYRYVFGLDGALNILVLATY